MRTTTVTLVESDWPLVSVTVSSNLYTPDVRFEMIIWSLYWVFYKVGNKIHRCRVIDHSLSWTLNKTMARSISNPTLFTHLVDGIRVSSKHFPLEGINPFVVCAPYAVQCHYVLRLDHQVLASISHWRTV